MCNMQSAKHNADSNHGRLTSVLQSRRDVEVEQQKADGLLHPHLRLLHFDFEKTTDKQDTQNQRNVSRCFYFTLLVSHSL